MEPQTQSQTQQPKNNNLIEDSGNEGNTTDRSNSQLCRLKQASSVFMAPNMVTPLTDSRFSLTQVQPRKEPGATFSDNESTHSKSKSKPRKKRPREAASPATKNKSDVGTKKRTKTKKTKNKANQVGSDQTM
ncbi:hypothetical protein PCASD_09921 [Puccinia coronata f. sp. avenae]|uniref:Uncharacterized protein n=1 Tax=Puccinia coronata f. sp. avenae TaxID=200324 RepID=A0A2N5UI21_9BASI|nr:hypothetical protein PCASD_09921 [Puccinia coronata f. sp. avenae]